MTYKPKFLKPGQSEVLQSGWKEEKPDDFSAIFFNPLRSLSLDTQRIKLPIFKYRNHILYLLEKYQTLVLVGETGCGKSTQVPQYLMEAGWTRDSKMVAVTQPRRIAATSLAARVAEEKGCILGQEVGYSIRFDDCYTPSKTKIKYLTEGILVHEMMSDPLLSQYSAIMLDEVHEQTLYTDVALGLLRKILIRRPELRLIVASATMEAERLAAFFNTHPDGSEEESTSVILGVEGRTFPVDVYYCNEPVPDYVRASIDTVIKIHQNESRGDVLVFLTGQDEVSFAVSELIDYARKIKDREDVNKLLVFPMYGALPASEQVKVFQPTPRNVRKVVVATNIAEASITINGIVFIVDCGFVKLRYFNPKTRTDGLVVVPVSQASAEQRAGRAGRVRAGKAFRLYTECDFEKLPAYTPPEIQRASLESVILQLQALGIQNVLRFHFPAAPPSGNVVAALELLYALGALDDDGKLTSPLGTRMAEFPLEPRFAKMLLISGEKGCSEEALTIAAMLQVQNVFTAPPNQSIQLRKAKYMFTVEEGDHITYLNVYNGYKAESNKKRWCDQNCVNQKGLERATEIRTQLAKLLKKFKIPLVSAEGDVDAVLRCIVSGFFANAAYLHHSGVYKTVRGDYPLHLHPSSVLNNLKRPPEWVVFNEVLHTSREFMRDVVAIDFKWLCELAPHYYTYGTEGEIAGQRNPLIF